MTKQPNRLGIKIWNFIEGFAEGPLAIGALVVIVALALFVLSGS